jgi:light-regulated signal transduction histidine kinase (bacteriophytochrome)
LAAPAFWITSCTQQLIQAKDEAARNEMALQLLDSVNYYNELLQSTIHSAKVMTKIDMPDLVPISVNKLTDYLWAKYVSIFQEKGLRFSIYKANQYLLEADGSVSVDAKAERTALNFHVACDEQILMRILNNLIMNALRNTSHGRVHVAFRKRHDGHCWVEVRDSGSGFDDADSDDWSANFNQVAQRIQRGKVKANEAASHGLGINNMKNLCTSIGSTMLLRSRSGEGTLFRFVLPLANPKEVPSEEHEFVLNKGIL